MTATVTQKQESPVAVLRSDYNAPPYHVTHVSMDFNLAESRTEVSSELHVVPAHQEEHPPPLVLDGRKDISLLAVSVAGKELSTDEYVLKHKSLTIKQPPQGGFQIEIKVSIDPSSNTALEGLYVSNGVFCTQCEPHGFRGITYMQDRPDVMATYKVRVEGEQASCPVLLSNGNLVDQGRAGEGRHFSVWEDPFPKPSYLFALVAGDLAVLEDKFNTMGGREVLLRVYSQPPHLSKLEWAMESLKTAMKWDEQRFGREYDLELFNVVAVDDFNMGAMENKSLNVFNSVALLGNAESASDAQMRNIQRIVAHEYFHNWTGNRVTCRDFFQLTLKEGLTVFRDQEFSMDLRSRPCYRIQQAIFIRNVQFTQDAGAMAHPIRPDSYISMDNFYTPTVYRKGAEVVRMYQTLLGRDGFRAGMDLYFQRHDGQAVTCEDFYAAMCDANNADLSSLFRWYGQAGTPTVTVSMTQEQGSGKLLLKATQQTPPTPGQDTKVPVLIPLLTGFLGKDGQEVKVKLAGSDAPPCSSLLLKLEEEQQEWVVEGVPGPVLLSTNRNFSSPVKLLVEGQRQEDLSFLLAHDTDPFNRWNAGQQLFKDMLLHLYAQVVEKGGEGSFEERYNAAGGLGQPVVDAVKSVLEDAKLDGEFKSLAISLPGGAELRNSIPQVDPLGLHHLVRLARREIASKLKGELQACATANDIPASVPYDVTLEQVSKRALKNTCLSYLASLGDPSVLADCAQRYHAAANMTDAMGALSCLLNHDCPERQQCLDTFEKKWGDQPLVMLKWFALQSSCNMPGNLTVIDKLMDHPCFSIKTPNAVSALLASVAQSPVNFHQVDGSGYEWYVDKVLQVDQVNGLVSARMANVFTQWKQYDTHRQGLIQAQLKRILASENLSDNLYEIVNKSVAT